jgi:hypothetical protein
VTIAQASAGMLEMTHLTQVSDANMVQYGNTAKKLMTLMRFFEEQANIKFDGLYSVNVNYNIEITPAFSYVTVGKQGMPFLSQLLKQSQLGNSKAALSLYSQFVRAINAIAKHLIMRSPTMDTILLNELYGYPYRLFPKMDIQTCSLAAHLAIDGIPFHLELAKELMKSCLKIADNFPAKFPPQMFTFNITQSQTSLEPFTHPGYDLSGDIFESLFVLYRLTGDESYREEGWKLFERLKDRARRDEGYAQIRDVSQHEKAHANRCPPYAFSSTFKFLYLLFAPRTYLPLNEYVFNHRGHPFKRISKPVDMKEEI